MDNKEREKYFQRLIRFLELEAEAEKEDALRDIQGRSPVTAEASGNSLINLVIREEDAGLGGRILLTLGKRNQSLSLPWTRLGSGSPVLLSEEGTTNESGWRGVVSRVDKNTIQVAFQYWPETETDRPTFRLDRSYDEISRQRQQQALENISRAVVDSRLAVLRDILLGTQPAIFGSQNDYRPLDSTLNKPQQAAVHFALSAEDIAIIHGPPGTGKTTTVVELIRQLTQGGQTVLACAPSNLAVDNILERLLAAGEKAVRLGHPARVLPALREHTLDLLVKKHPNMRLAEKLTREAYALREQSFKFTRARPEPGAKQSMRQEAKQMLAEARQIEDQVFESLLDSARILCVTTTGLDRNLIGQRIFDWCVMDEAGQSTEPGAWIPVQYARRLVLAGDHCQLPPTVVSAEAAAGGFGISLLERLVTKVDPAIARRLVIQYRMHQQIMAFSSREFYEDSLIADPTVSAHLLKDLDGIETNGLTETPVHFIDTAGASYDEVAEPGGESRFNPLEAELVIRKVQSFLDAGLKPTDVAIITPYAAQVKLLREKLKQPEIEVDSVDGFQGREKEAVVVSLVRSNREGEIGFLEDTRRMNVALTRARRKLVVIGDSATITSHPFYQDMVSYFEAIGAYHSVWEEMDRP